jgi:uncharacterized protein (DUF2249 family)
MTADIVDLDVRPILASGSDPFAEIMAAVAALEPGQGLRIIAPFRPAPLIQVLGSKGFSHQELALPGGAWEMTFRPRPAPAIAGAITTATQSDAGAWPDPVRLLDNRDLDPPEPMVRILAAAEQLAAGEVLSALLHREPTFLLPELAKRGHQWQGAFEPDGKTYRLLVRAGTSEARS